MCQVGAELRLWLIDLKLVAMDLYQCLSRKPKPNPKPNFSLHHQHFVTGSLNSARIIQGMTRSSKSRYNVRSALMPLSNNAAMAGRRLNREERGLEPGLISKRGEKPLRINYLAIDQGFRLGGPKLRMLL
jgi:hypothetical protein